MKTVLHSGYTVTQIMMDS